MDTLHRSILSWLGKSIYVVEMKMFDSAKVYGDIKKSKWNYYKHGKKYEIYSPLKQNRKHIEYFKEFDMHPPKRQA